MEMVMVDVIIVMGNGNSDGFIFHKSGIKDFGRDHRQACSPLVQFFFGFVSEQFVSKQIDSKVGRRQ